MASPAQILANQANAQHSTGPKTDAGKAKASRNNIKHGLCLGILVLTPEQQAYIAEFEAKMRQEMRPAGALEETVFAQFIDAAARLHKITSRIGALFLEHNEDPLIIPDAAAELNQLSRYRATAEMQLYSTINTLMEMQTTRLSRELHVVKAEQAYIPPMVKGSAAIWFGDGRRNHNERELFYAMHPGPDPLFGRLPELPPRPPGYGAEYGFTGANPMPI